MKDEIRKHVEDEPEYLVIAEEYTDDQMPEVIERRAKQNPYDV